MFDCPVLSTLAQPGCVVKVASCDRLTSKQRTKVSLMDLYALHRHYKAIGEENYFFECENISVKNYNSRKAVAVANLRNNQTPRGTFFDRPRIKY